MDTGDALEAQGRKGPFQSCTLVVELWRLIKIVSQKGCDIPRLPSQLSLPGDDRILNRDVEHGVQASRHVNGVVQYFFLVWSVAYHQSRPERMLDFGP